MIVAEFSGRGCGLSGCASVTSTELTLAHVKPSEPPHLRVLLESGGASRGGATDSQRTDP